MPLTMEAAKDIRRGPKTLKNRAKIAHKMCEADLNAALERRNPEDIRNIVASFTPLALRISNALNQSMPPTMDQDDLLQEGCLGLIHAAKNYNQAFGVKFVTYAYWCARGYMLKCINATYSTIRLPKELRMKLAQGVLSKQDTEFWCQFQRVQGLDEEQAVDARKFGLCRRANEDHPIYSIRDLDDAHSDALDARFVWATAREVLSNREYKILQMRSEDVTMRDIGSVLGISRERVRQIEEVALFKLKQHYSKRGSHA